MEKRARQRKKTRLSVRFGAERPDKLGLITDVSARGIYITTNAILPHGSAVHVHVPVPGGEPLRLDGRVTRTRRVASALVLITTGGMGVRLENTPPAWRASQALPEDRNYDISTRSNANSTVSITIPPSTARSGE